MARKVNTRRVEMGVLHMKTNRATNGWSTRKPTAAERKNKRRKFKRLSKYPYSAIPDDAGALTIPGGVSFRSWKRGLKNRWGSIAEVDFTGEQETAVLKWLKENKVEYCRHYFQEALFYFSEEWAAIAALTLKGTTR